MTVSSNAPDELTNQEDPMKPLSLIALALLTFASMPAWAGVPSPQLPEPGVLELLAVGAIAGVAVAIRNRRKK